MLTGVKKVLLLNDDETTRYGDINFCVSGKDINDSCYMDEVMCGRFGLKDKEIDFIVGLAKEMILANSYAYELDLVTGKITKN